MYGLDSLSMFDAWEDPNEDPLEKMMRLYAMQQQQAVTAPVMAPGGPQATSPVVDPAIAEKNFFEALYSDPRVQQQANDRGLRGAGLALLSGAASNKYADTLARAFAAYDDGRQGQLRQAVQEAEAVRIMERQAEADRRAEQQLVISGRIQDRIESAQAAAAEKKRMEEEAKRRKEEADEATSAEQQERLNKAVDDLVAAGKINPQVAEALRVDIARNRDISSQLGTLTREEKPPAPERPRESDINREAAEKFVSNALPKLPDGPVKELVSELAAAGDYQEAQRLIVSERKPKEQGDPTIANVLALVPDSEKEAAKLRLEKATKEQLISVGSMLQVGHPLERALSRAGL